MLLKKFRKPTCEIKSMENELLIVGKVKNIFQAPSLTIDVDVNAAKSLYYQPVGLPVKVLLKEGKNVQSLGGLIASADAKICRVHKLTYTSNMERRQFFRVRVRATGDVTVHTDQDDKSIVAKLIDVSLSGIRFASTDFIPLEEIVELTNLTLVKDDIPFEIKCKVLYKDEIKKEEHVEGYIYRCSIEDMSEAEQDRLAKAIFELQRDHIKALKSTF